MNPTLVKRYESRRNRSVGGGGRAFPACVESLEARCLLAVMASNSFGLNPTTHQVDIPAIQPVPDDPFNVANDSYVHNFSLTLQDGLAGNPSTNANGLETASVNASQIVSSMVHVTLNGVVHGPYMISFLHHVIQVEIVVTKAGTNDLVAMVDVTHATDLNSYDANSPDKNKMRDTVTFSGAVDLPVADASDIVSVKFTNKTNGNHFLLMPFFALTVDTTAPVVTGVTQFSGTRTVPVDSVTVNLNDAISTFDTSAVTLTRDGTDVPLSGLTTTATDPSNINFSISGLTAFTSISGQHHYVLSVDSTKLRDDAGNQVATPTSSTAAFDVSIAGPTAVVTGPMTPRNTPVPSIAVTFSKPIDPATFTNAALGLTLDGMTVSLPGTVLEKAVGGSSTDFTIDGLDLPTTAQGTYVLTITTSSITDTFGNHGTDTPSDSVSFVVDTTPPTISSVAVPTTIIAPLGPLDVTLSKPVVASTFLPAAVTLTRNGHPLTLSGITVTPVAGSSTDFSIGGLDAFTHTSANYVFTIDPSGIHDPVGNAGAGGLTHVPFTAKILGPSITGFGATTPRNIPVANLPVTFSNLIDASTFAPSLSLTFNGTPLPTGGLTFSPASGLASTITIGGLGALTSAQGTYVLTVDLTMVRDPFGNPASGAVNSFTIVVDTTPPRIAQVVPLPLTVTTSLDKVAVTISKTIMANSFTSADVSLTLNGVRIQFDAPPHGGINVMALRDSDAKIDPDNDFDESNNFVVSGLSPFTANWGHYVLTISPAGTLDPAGNAGTGAPVSIGFDFNPGPPRPTGLSLPGSNLRVAPVSTIDLTLSSPIDPTSLTFQSLALSRGRFSVPLTSAVRAVPISPMVYRITGLEAFTSAAGQYVLTVNGKTLHDPNGVTGVSSASTSFQVVAIPHAGPSITQIHRVTNSRHATSVVLTFDRLLNASTARYLDNYRLYAISPGKPPRSIRLLSATYNANTISVTLLPIGRLAPTGLYVVRVTGSAPRGVADTVGHPLEGLTQTPAGSFTFAPVS